MKKIAIALVLIFTTVFVPNVNANQNIDHAAMMEYDGYGKAMYEAVAKETAYLAGTYTNNRDYVKSSIDEIGEYARTMYDEMERIGESNSFKELISGAGGLFLTALDSLKRMFSKKAAEEIVIDYSYLSVCTKTYNGSIKHNGVQGCRVYITYVDSGVTDVLSNEDQSITIYSARTSDQRNGLIYINTPNHREQSKERYSVVNGVNDADAVVLKITNLNAFMSYLSSQNVLVTVYKDDVEQKQMAIDNKFTVINNYINSSDFDNKKVVIPTIKTTLVCPDNTRVAVNISGDTFIAADGRSLVASADGYVEIDSQLCKLNFEPPDMDYVDDRPAIKDGDDWRDIETGEIIGGNAVDCDGVLCFLSSIIKSITGLVGQLLNGLVGLLVPDNLDFLRDEINQLTATLTEKISITEDIKTMLTSVFVETNVNPLQGISINIPIVGKDFKFGDVPFINDHVSTLKRVMSALLWLMTIIYVYRKITGRGGVMEK